jgi:hypothetical protein
VATDDVSSPDANSVLFGDEDRITDRRTVESKYETVEGQRVLWVKTERVTIALNVQDVIEYFEWRFVAHPHLTDENA